MEMYWERMGHSSENIRI